jgi:hypothetical protein
MKEVIEEPEEILTVADLAASGYASVESSIMAWLVRSGDDVSVFINKWVRPEKTKVIRQSSPLYGNRPSVAATPNRLARESTLLWKRVLTTQ